MSPQDQLQSPGSPEGPDESAEPKSDVSQAHYRPSGVNCQGCEYFDGQQACSKGVNGGTVEPEGGCDLFEPGGDSGAQPPPGGAPPPSGPPAGGMPPQ